MATLGGDWHTVNDTMLAYGQLLVVDPERIGPVQAIGMDQTRVGFGFRTFRNYRTRVHSTQEASTGTYSPTLPPP